jgi:hypothetical protein
MWRIQSESRTRSSARSPRNTAWAFLAKVTRGCGSTMTSARVSRLSEFGDFPGLAGDMGEGRLTLHVFAAPK